MNLEIKLITLSLLFSVFFTITVYADSKPKSPVLYRPVFKVNEHTVRAGSAFIIKHKGSHYAISAQHLIGKAGGLDKDYKGKDLVGAFKKITLSPIYTGYKSLTSFRHVAIPHADSISNKNAENDIFISPLPAVIDSTPFMLATSIAKVGDKVMLYAMVANSKELIHTATVMKSTNKELVYVFDNKQLNLSATSGAPIINQKEQVLGINLSGGKLANGYVVGMANPFVSIINNLRK